MVHHDEQLLRASDAHDVHVHAWRPGGNVSQVVQIVHGLGEYAARYERFANAAAERGIAVVAHDQRGHGSKADDPGYFAPKDGWHKLIDDVELVNDAIRTQHEGTPVVLLGHSMGSYVAQNFAMYHGSRIAALVLSASTWPSKLRLWSALALAHAEGWRVGAGRHSGLLHSLGFGSFNRPFEPARTALDWLSRDEAEVDRYIADPLCGGPLTCGLWQDLIGGLLKITSDNEILRIPSDLPILITGGERDPVGGDKGMGRLATHYAQTLHSRLTVKIYPDGRHEMLNETNRDEVTRDWLDWIDATTRNSR